MVKYIFERIGDSPSELEFSVKVSMIEIYMEKIRDLLDPVKTNLKVHEDKQKGIYIADVTETYVGEEYEVYDIMRLGNEHRAIGCTDMNAQSSRSHSCFVITIHMNNTVDFSSKTGKLYLVDLAGSEKIAKTGATGMTLEEAKTINKSLSTLGLVINNLTDGKSTHIPYRDSKLTRVLQESLGGNARTALIITCSPAKYNLDETVSTLKFGARAKQVKNKPKINKELTVQELKFLLQEQKDKAARLERRVTQLELYIKTNKLALPPDANLSDADLKKMEKQANADKRAAEEEAAKVAAANELKSREELELKLAEASAAVAEKFTE